MRRPTAAPETSGSSLRLGAALLLPLLLLAGPAAGQKKLSLLDDGSSSPVVVESSRALETASAAFRREIDWIAEKTLREQGVEAIEGVDLERLKNEHRQEFETRCQREVNRLQMDGALTLEEVTSTLREISDESASAFETRLDAHLGRCPPPPVWDKEDAFHHYAMSLARYTISERNSLSNWLYFFATIVASVFLVFLFSLAATATARWIPATGSPRIRSLLGSVRGPVYGLSISSATAIGLGRIWLPPETSGFVSMTAKLAIVLSLLWLTWNLCGGIASLFNWLSRKTRNDLDDQLVDIVRKTLRIFTLCIFILVVAEVLFDTDIPGILTGLGILGLAVSLAAQDTLRNLIASFTILGDEPFRLGDWMKFRDYFGQVEAIGFRSTKVRTLDGHLVAIPNAELVREPMENVEARPFIRFDFHVDIPYDTPIEKVDRALEIVRDIVDSRDEQPEGAESHVFLDSLGDYSLRIRVVAHHSPADYWAAQQGKSRINQEILSRFREEDIGFAFPTRTQELKVAGEALPIAEA